jgi:hypothetical protein
VFHKSWRWWPILLALAALTAIGADSSSCGPNTGGSAAGGGNSGTKTVAVGQPMASSDGRTATVTAFKRAYTGADQLQAPAAGKECVQVSWSLVNGSKTEWQLPTFELSVVDANGQKYSADFTCGTSDNIQSLVAGGKGTANEVYQVVAGGALNAVWVPNQFETAVFQTPLK